MQDSFLLRNLEEPKDSCLLTAWPWCQPLPLESVILRLHHIPHVPFYVWWRRYLLLVSDCCRTNYVNFVVYNMPLLSPFVVWESRRRSVEYSAQPSLLLSLARLKTRCLVGCSLSSQGSVREGCASKLLPVAALFIPWGYGIHHSFLLQIQQQSLMLLHNT